MGPSDRRTLGGGFGGEWSLLFPLRPNAEGAEGKREVVQATKLPESLMWEGLAELAASGRGEV